MSGGSEAGGVELVVQPDPVSLTQEAAERVVRSAEQSISARGLFALVLAGGSTPAALYERLASREVAGRLDWSRTHLFFGDERCVPPDHEWSNYAMSRRTLLDHVPVSHENIHRIRGEEPPDMAAAEYAAALCSVLPCAGDTLPHFDLILLGMGDDGHTASLFPAMPALEERWARVVASRVPEYVRPQVERVTLSLPVLNAAREVLFLVTGRAKADAVQRVFDPEETAPLPAARVRPSEGLLTWLLDEPAASLLKRV